MAPIVARGVQGTGAAQCGQPTALQGGASVAGDAVVVVPYHTGYKKLVVTREFRVTLGDYEYGFPAGLIEKGESVEQATRRELTEETGLSVTRFTRISPPVYTMKPP